MTERLSHRLRRRQALGLLALPALPSLAWAQTPGVDVPPLAAPPRPIQMPPLFEHVLPNGLRLVVAPRSTVPLVGATLLVRRGAEADPAGRSGLASMTATLLAKGAQRGARAVQASELAAQAEALGGTLDTASGWRLSSVAMGVTTPKLGAALALMADVVRRPLLQAGELERARAQALDAIRLTLSSPGAVAAEAARRAYWTPAVYGATPTAASLQRLRRADVQQFHARHYRPDRAVLVLAGDLSFADALALAQTHFGGWVAPPQAPAALQIAVPAADPARQVLIDMPGSGQSGVVLLASGPALLPAERRIGQVATAVLGGGYSARLNQEVRIKRGLSYGVGAELSVQPEGSLFMAQAQTNHPTAAQVLALLRAEVLRLGDTPPAAEELAARQATLVGGFARQLETAAGLSSLVVGQLLREQPLAELSRYVEQVLAVTPEQVRDFARRHWAADKLRAVVAGEAAAAGAALRELDAQQLELPLAALDLDQPGLRAPAKR